jgi:hypothetical protein
MAGERVECCDGLEFDVVEVADTMGWQLSLVKRGLRQLQWSTEKSGERVCSLGRYVYTVFICLLIIIQLCVCVCVCVRVCVRVVMFICRCCFL